MPVWRRDQRRLCLLGGPGPKPKSGAWTERSPLERGRGRKIKSVGMTDPVSPGQVVEVGPEGLPRGIPGWASSAERVYGKTTPMKIFFRIVLELYLGTRKKN